MKPSTMEMTNTKKNDYRPLFFSLTIALSLGIWVAIYVNFGQNLIDTIFDLTGVDDQFITLPFYPIKFGNSAGYVGLICASVIPQTIFNSIVCLNDELKTYKYFLSMLIAVIGAGAYVLVLCFISIIIAILVFIGLLILVFAVILGS